MRTLPIFLGLLLALACACKPRPSSQSPEIRVAAASHLNSVLPDLVAAFEKSHPQLRIAPTFGSSGNFRSQIANGAPFDLFLSADMAFPESLIAEKHAVAKSLFTYGSGRIVLWHPHPANPPADLTNLLAPSIRKIAIANPAHAPYGRAAIEALEHANLHATLAPQLVLAENAAQAAQFLHAGSADIGIIPLTLALSPPMQASGSFFLIPESHHRPIHHGGIIPTRAAHPGAAAEFRAFLLSPTGREILTRHGFTHAP